MRSPSENRLVRDRARELRKAKRTPKRHAVWIRLNSSGILIPCVLWDISDGGARLAAPHSSFVPNVFNLVLTKDGKSQRRCRVAWRNTAQLGVQFIQDSAASADSDVLSFRPRQKVETARPQGPRPSQQEVIAGCTFMLQGSGLRNSSGAYRRGFAISSAAAGLAILLAGATVLFIAAGLQTGIEASWASQVCEGTRNFCEHPELTGAAGALMTIVYLSTRGMER